MEWIAILILLLMVLVMGALFWSLSGRHHIINENLAKKEQDLTALSDKLYHNEQQCAEYRAQIAVLKVQLIEKDRQLQQQSEQFMAMKASFKDEFHHLAQHILDEKSKKFDEQQHKSLKHLLLPLKEQINSFQERVNKVHSENLKEQSSLSEYIRQLLQTSLNMSKDAQNLTNALKGNNKVMGNWGEMQLENALQATGLIKGESYESQGSFKNDEHKSLKPDFIIYLPDNKHIIIDAKVSLLDYEQFCDIGNENQREVHLKNHCLSIRKHVADLSAKDYCHLIGLRSPEFVLMFVPIESAYLEALKYDRSLFEDAYHKNVILVSYTTLMPILRTVAHLWRLEKSQSKAQEIGQRAGDIYTQVIRLIERFEKLGNALNAANNSYNSTLTALVGNQGLYKKVTHFKELSAKLTSQTLTEPKLMENSCEIFRIEPILSEIHHKPREQSQ